MVETTKGLMQFFQDDHRRCDELWAEVEKAVEAGEGDGIGAAFESFDASLRHHLTMEEDFMFPAFEAATGMSGGPTEVMRMEHVQMRGVLDQMRQALVSGEHQEILDQGDTLLMLIQQHNQKEEGILYPMAEQVLAGQWDELKGRLP